ncbi:MAG: ATP-dependent Clp protease adaptor ClpS [Planctomycetota bacterium]|nr:MAG: ATP-dependent Clp protease adaptor ClpS [Planctomycetota bacterium]
MAIPPQSPVAPRCPPAQIHAMSTVTVPKPIETTATDLHPGWRVVLLNDNVNDYLMVIFALQRAAGLSVEVAEMVTREAHESGSAVVKRGLNEEDAKIMCGALKKYSRIPGVTPGVEAIAEVDD